MQFLLGSYGCKRELSSMSDGDMWGERKQSCVLLVYPILSCPHFISKKLLCKLQAKFLASQDSFHMVWGLRWDWEVCCPSAFTVNDRISAAALISFFLL